MMLPSKARPWVAGLLAAALAGGFLVVLYLYPPAQHAFYPRCLLRSLTGWSCPGCGSLRAAHHFLHGEFATAFRLNPLWVLLLPFFAAAALAYVVRVRTGRQMFAAFRRPFWIWLLAAVIVGFGILRNVPLGRFAGGGD